MRRFICELIGHTAPAASEWRQAGRDNYWTRIVWCTRCDGYRPEACSGPTTAPLGITSPLHRDLFPAEPSREG